MLVIDRVNFAYGDRNPLLREISLSVAPGEKLCLLGLNGSGKTTLLRLIAGLLKPTSGRIQVLGAETVSEQAMIEVREKLGLVFQNPREQIVTSTVGGDIVFTLENLGWPEKKMAQALDTEAKRLGLQALLGRHPFTLSAGQEQRTALAGVFAPGPQLLLLDEPSSYLDYHGRQLLRETIDNDSLTVIAATQFLEEAKHFERVLLLDSGVVAFDGPPDRLFESTALKSVMTEDVSGPPEVGGAKPLGVRAKDLHFAYQGGEQVLDGIDLNLAGGSINAIIGDSGSGKTTLGKLLAGLLEPQQGSVELTPQGKLSESVSFVMQFPEMQLFAETVAEEVAFGPRNAGLTGDDLDLRVRAAMQLVDLDYEKFATRLPFKLSGGEQRRLALASILALQRPVLILDEPTAGLDWLAAAQLRRVLLELRRAGYTIILLTHDLDLAGRVADELILLDQGKLLWSGSKYGDLPQDLFARHFGGFSQSLATARELKAAGLSAEEIEARLLPIVIEANL